MTPGRRDLRLLVTTVALLPLLVLVAAHLLRLLEDPWLVAYGVGVLGSTVFLFFRAYTAYDDPSDPASRPLRGDGDAPPLEPGPMVSLLVAVHNERDVIEACLRSLVASDHPHLQVIVVDDASTDGTTDELRRLRGELGFTLLPLARNVGKKQALVAGALLATGRVIAFTDSDCVLDPQAISRCVAALEHHPSLGAVSGHARALNGDRTVLTRAQDTWYEGSFRVTKAAEASFGTVTCVSGPLAVFRREAVWNYLPAWAEDRFLGAEFRFATDRQLTAYVLGQRWRGEDLQTAHAGSPFVRGEVHPPRAWNVGYVRSARVWTVVPERARSFLRQQVRWKKSFTRNLAFNGPFLWHRGLGASALYYGHVLWVLLAPVMAVRHLVWAPLHGMWLLMLLYLAGVVVKGTAWGISFAIDNPGSTRWRYRPVMSLVSSVVLSWLLPYSVLTIRRGVWARGA